MEVVNLRSYHTGRYPCNNGVVLKKRGVPGQRTEADIGITLPTHRMPNTADKPQELEEDM